MKKTYFYKNSYNTSIICADNDSVDINLVEDNISSISAVKIIPTDVDEIIVCRNNTQHRIVKHIKADTVIFIIDEYVYKYAIEKNIDVKLIYTQDEISELVKFKKEYYDCRDSEKLQSSCGDCDCCRDVC